MLLSFSPPGLPVVRFYLCYYISDKPVLLCFNCDISSVFAKVSLANAEKAKNEDYVKMNNDSIKEWSKK